MTRPPRQHTTQKTVAVPVVLVVGGSDLVEHCRAIVKSPALPPAHVKRTDLADAATNAARWRPLAIVLTRDVYEFDAAEFDALAKDVGALVVPVASERAPGVALGRTLARAVVGYWERYDASGR